ncbi:protein CLEC16A homolog [Scaptodrosophila lebanonensis]|uniref:Protein CLEC16A homolog n=1 Tax=Drosophila lebanonensis TaxID=7225 RepID=A0A6J2THX2_DROLE|nr:protein CLEC16A homolog [Scaptodrosophila lebanonensis]
MDRSCSSVILRSDSTPLEDLKLQHNILKNNTIVSEKNATLLVESLHLTAYLLLLGDRSDSQLIDYFVKSRMLNNWIHLMRQKNRNQSWNSVSVKFLQTFSTLCYNIRKEAFLAHLLSEVNVIIRLEYNFSDEDAILYYVNFLRMLSFRINNQTIQFFYNELIYDFPLYTEAMRFLYHSESEVRTAVRTISLNVYKFSDASMLRFIGDKAAFANFYNLVWHIGKQMMDVDKYLNTDTGHEAAHTLLNLLAEHFDHLDYINDILLLDIGDLKVKLTKHFLHKLFITFVVLSLDPSPPQLNSTNYQNFHNSTMSSITAMYFLSLVFLISAHAPLVQGLAWVILNGNHESLETELNCFIEEVSAEASKTTLKATNTTTVSKPFLDFILRSLECSQNDHKAMPALCLLFTMHTNRGKHIKSKQNLA